MKWPRPMIFWSLTLAAIVTLFIVIASSFPIYRDWAFICKNTASQKGYREWFFGLKTGHWYEKSALEEFVISHRPEVLVNRWTSYAGTGINFYGTPVLFSHGRPGAVLQCKQEVLQWWIKHHSDEEVFALYKLLVSDDQAAIGDKIASIWDEVLKYKD